MFSYGGISKHFELLQNAHAAADVLLNGKNTDIPISNELRDQVLEMVAHYRDDLGKHKEYEAIFSRISQDVNKLTGKNRAYVLKDFSVNLPSNN